VSRKFSRALLSRKTRSPGPDWRPLPWIKNVPAKKDCDEGLVDFPMLATSGILFTTSFTAVLVYSKYFADCTRTVFHARETARSGERRMMRNPAGCHLFHVLHFLPTPQLCSPSLATTPPKHHFNPTPDRILKRTAKLWIPWNPYHGKMSQMRLGNRLHPDRPRIRGTGI
jgi:hypothetical protein